MMSLQSRLRRGISVLLVLVALVSQVAVGAMVVPDVAPASQADALAAASVPCGQPGERHLPVRHRAGDPAVCPLAVALGLPSVVPVAPVVFARRPLAAVWVAWDGTAAGGALGVLRRVGSPRGPPILV